MVGTGIAAGNGNLCRFRNPESLEIAYQIDVVVFDKTGTLTPGKTFSLPKVSHMTSRSRDEILGLAASVERKSEHPVAEAIVAGAPGKEYPVE